MGRDPPTPPIRRFGASGGSGCNAGVEAQQQQRRTPLAGSGGRTGSVAIVDSARDSVVQVDVKGKVSFRARFCMFIYENRLLLLLLLSRYKYIILYYTNQDLRKNYVKLVYEY